MEQQSVQATFLCNKCEQSTQFALKRWMLYIRSCQALLFSGNWQQFQLIPRTSSSDAHTAFNQLGEVKYARWMWSSLQKWSATETSNCSRKPSITKDELQEAPLTKAKILDVYSDIFSRIGKFPGELYKFQLKENAKLTRGHAPRKVPIHLQDAFHKEI